MTEFSTPNEIIPAPDGEGNVAYNAAVVTALQKEIIGGWEEERLHKYPWARSLVGELVQRIANLRALHKRAEDKGYAAGLEAAAAYLDKIAAVAAADPTLTGGGMAERNCRCHPRARQGGEVMVTDAQLKALIIPECGFVAPAKDWEISDSE